MPDWQTVPEDDFNYAYWLHNINNYENELQELDDLDDGTAEECGYDFKELDLDEAEGLWDFGTL